MKISLDAWEKHALQLEDDRFRCHSTFVFYVHNVLTRRKVSLAAKLKLKSGKFNKGTDDMIQSMTVEDLENVLKALEKNERIEDSRLLQIMSLFKSTGAMIAGSPYAKNDQRQEINALQIYLGTPTFFITI